VIKLFLCLNIHGKLQDDCPVDAERGKFKSVFLFGSVFGFVAVNATRLTFACLAEVANSET